MFDDGQGNSSSDGETFTAEGRTLTLGGVAYDASLDGNRLTLANDNAQFDFDSDGSDDPAMLGITLARR